MFVFSYVISAFADAVHWVLQIYMWMIVIRAVLSWVNPGSFNRIVRFASFNTIVRFLDRATEPVLRPVRRMIPMHQIGLDLSPMIVIIVLIILDRNLVPLLHQIANEFR